MARPGFPYLAVDIETTGLDRNKSHILQLAAVYDNDPSAAVEDLPTFSCQIRWPLIVHAEAGALAMNYQMLGGLGLGMMTPEQARNSWLSFLEYLGEEGRMTMAGKNAGGFDMPIMANPVNCFDLSKFKHRVLDPGTLFASHFDEIPSLDQIARLIGAPAVDHTALGDCRLVVQAIRWSRTHE